MDTWGISTQTLGVTDMNGIDIVAFLSEWFNAGFNIGISEAFQFILSLIWALLGL